MIKAKLVLILLILFTLVLAMLAGCATTTQDLGAPVVSTTDAGITSYQSEPVLAPEGSVAVGERTRLVFGKEYGALTGRVDFRCQDGQPILIEFEASEVRAFEGQAVAAGAVVAVRESLSERDQEIFDGISGVVGEALSAYLGALPIGCPQ